MLERFKLDLDAYVVWDDADERGLFRNGRSSVLF
jgi:hypothetical protein